jgi:chitodextrinase
MSRRTRAFAFAAAVITVATIATGPVFAPAALAAADTQPPTAPGTPVAVSVTNVQITLAWAPSTDDVAVTGYDIFRSSGAPTSFVAVGTSTTNSFVDTGLSPGTIYLYRIRARDAAGNLSAFSPIIPAMTAGPCTTPPPAPGNLTVLAFGSTSVSLRWGIVVPSAGCSPAGFDVLRATGDSGSLSPIAQTGFTDTYVDTTVMPNTTYRYQVRSRSANGLVSGPSNAVRVTTPDGCTPPLPLGSLTVTATTVNSVSLSWAGPTNPACFAYDILRAPGATGTNFTVVGTTTGLSFTNVGLTISTAYRYMVRARIVPTGAVWATTNPVVATTNQGCSLIPPPAPGNLTAAAVTATSVTLTWAVTAAPGCSFSYEILRAPGASGGGTLVQVGTATGNSFTDTGLTPNTTYRYQARTRDAAGNLSALSNTVTVTTIAGTGGCTASYRIVNAWPGAFNGEVAVTNTGAGNINGWQVTLTLNGGATITQLWGGRTSQTASPYTVANETYNGNLATGGTTTFGFNANVTGSTGAAGTVNCTAG